MNLPKVFIIILNWNGLEDTLECLKSVFKMDYPNFKVIVVDNGSTDNSVAVIQGKYPEVIMIENKDNLGYTGGNNVAMGYAMQNGTDYMWLLNNDSIAEQDTLSKLVATAEVSPKIGLVNPVIYDYYNPDKIQFCGSYIDWRKQDIVYTKNVEEFKIWQNKYSRLICLWGTALLIKRDLIENIGYLNGRFFAYWEDTDFSVRSIKGGYRNVIELSARIRHKINPGTARSTAYFYYMARNKYYFWMNYLRDLNKLYYLRKYFSGIIETFGVRLQHNGTEYGDAVLDGAWGAICGINGEWDKNVRVPYSLKKIISWHPYFWASLLRGEFLHIASEVLKRTKMEIFKTE
jgi:hypothetical protein